MTEKVCPACMGVLRTADGKSAACSVHGGSYRILFWRGLELAVPAMASASVGGDRTSNQAIAAQAAPSVPGSSPVTSVASPTGLASSTGVAAKMCYLHPTAVASGYCGVCRLPICQTCDFSFATGTGEPTGVLNLGGSRQIATHLCPRCAGAPRQNVKGSRRNLVVWSYVLAGWSTLAFLLQFLAARVEHTKENTQAIVVAMAYLVLFPALIGTALGMAGIDRRLSNPTWIKAPAIWNGIILGIFLLLMIIGLLK